MIDQQTQEWAALGALQILPGAEQADFEARLASDAELRAFVAQLHETTADLAALLPPVTPSPGVKNAILAAIQPASAESTPLVNFPQPSRPPLWPWALAACFAITSAFLFLERDQSQREIATLRNQANLTGMELRLLRGTAEVPANSAALVAWDERNQRGLIQLEKIPDPQTGRDYQLWILDPAYVLPVNGGIIRANAGPREFHPDAKIQKATNFVITLERTGGVPKAEGPAILAGEKM